MIDVEDFIRKLQENFIKEFPDSPKLSLKWKRNGKEEGFSLSYAGGEITLIAESPFAAVSGMSLLRVAVSSGHLLEYLGEHHPKFSLRPLWVRNLGENSWFKDVHYVERMCQRILLLGYNTIIFDLSSLQKDDVWCSLQKILDIVTAYGIKISIKLIGDPSKVPFLFDDDYCESLEEILLSITERSKYIDYLFWESTIYTQEVNEHHKVKDFLQIDLARLEVEKLEEQLKGSCRLIYSIPTQNTSIAKKQGKWIPQLSHEISENTTIAFSAHAGDPLNDFLPLHPIWETLRTSNNSSFLNLLPIINSGLVKQGEGLWPIFSQDQTNCYLSRCKPSVLSGVITMTTHVPRENALLSCNLWVTAQTLWRDGSPSLLMDTWIRAFRPEYLQYDDLEKILQEIREISLKVGFLIFNMDKSEKELSKNESRTLADSLLSRLAFLQTTLEDRTIESTERVSLKQYFTFFARDARRMILRFLQHYQMPMVGVLNGDDMKESFWTEISSPNSQGLISGVKVLLLDEPHRGESGSIMAEIYDEVIGNIAD